MKYYVISQFYDDGVVTADLLLESEYAGQQPIDNRDLSQYIDTFETFEEAEKHYKDCLAISSKKVHNRILTVGYNPGSRTIN